MGIYMDMDLAKQTFVQESKELLEQMEQNLLILEESPQNEEALGAVFRAAHTIKGTAGMFQYESIVHFVHVVENVLDRARNHEIGMNSDLIAILLSCHDHTEKLVSIAVTESGEVSQQVYDQGQLILGQLAAFSEDKAAQKIMQQKESPAPVKETVSPLVESLNIETQKGESVKDRSLAEESSMFDKLAMKRSPYWHISFRPEAQVIRQGLDPYSFLRYLYKIGEIVNLTTVSLRMPVLSELNPEDFYLSFEVELKAEASQETILKAFDFIIEDAQIDIISADDSLARFALLWLKMIKETGEPFTNELFMTYVERLGSLFLYNQAITEEEKDLLINAFREFVSSVDEETSSPSSTAKKENEHAIEEGELLQATQTEKEESTSDSQDKAKKEVVQKVSEPMNLSAKKNVVDASGKEESSQSRVLESRFVRVDAEKLNELINLVGELVIASASVTNLADKNEDTKLVEATSLMSRLVSEMRDKTLNIRMVQIGETFNRYKRVVRDLSHEMSKEIDLVISGGETELDKTVIEKIADPLTHLIRNAVDHGIDKPDVRISRGKDRRGTIYLNAFHETGSIVIEVIDDGEGINKDKLIHKAIEKGVIQPNQQLSDKEIYQLIFHAGLSTADKVTDVSGRGVGMDVVKRNIEALRGIVDIVSEAGKGTTVRIRLPLTLAIIDGFFVGVGNTTWVVPLDMVVECLQFDKSKLLSENGDQDNEDFINLRGEVLPFLRLHELFGHEVEGGKQHNIVVVQYAGQKAGLLVDRLLGEFQTVIKPLGPIFQHLRGISGSTIMGSGEIALIIDVPRLVQYAREKEEAYRVEQYRAVSA